MIFQQVWNRFTQNWKDFATLGMGTGLVMLGVGVVVSILAMIMVGPGIFTVLRSPSQYGALGLYGIIAGALLFFFVAMIVAVPAGSFIYGGTMACVVAYRHGEPPSLATFWANGKRYFTRFLGLTVLTWVGLAVLTIVTSPISRIPGIGYLISSAAQSIVIVHLMIYPAYLIVTEGLSVIDAVQSGFRIITQNVQEAALSGLVMMAFNFVLVLTALINIIPLLGQIAYLGVLVVYGPLMIYYFAERFETNVRPSLGGSAPGQA